MVIIDYKNLPPDFDVSYRDGRVLVTPSRTKHAWKNDELHLRSLLLDESGKVLSAGFPKFFNLHERPEDGVALERALAKEWEILVQEKKDGSLIIVSVIDGQLHMRTRGSFDLGTFHAPVTQLFETKYPMFLSIFRNMKSFHCSVLFEYVGPENRIIVPYEEAQLYFLATISNENLTDSDLRFLRKLNDCWLPPSWIEEFPVPEYYTWNGTQEELKESVLKWRDREGLVIHWYDREQDKKYWVKLKSKWYLALHAIKFPLSPQKVTKLCYLLDVRTKADLTKFYEFGLDAEIISMIVEKPALEYIARRDLLLNRLSNLAAIAAQNRHLERKEYVEKIAKPGSPEFATLMALYDSKYGLAETIALAPVVGVSTRELLAWQLDRKTTIEELLRCESSSQDPVTQTEPPDTN